MPSPPSVAVPKNDSSNAKSAVSSDSLGPATSLNMVTRSDGTNINSGSLESFLPAGHKQRDIHHQNPPSSTSKVHHVLRIFSRVFSMCLWSSLFLRSAPCVAA